MVDEMGLPGALAREQLRAGLKRQPTAHQESQADKIQHQLEEEEANDRAEEAILSANGTNKGQCSLGLITFKLIVLTPSTL